MKYEICPSCGAEEDDGVVRKIEGRTIKVNINGREMTIYIMVYKCLTCGNTFEKESKPYVE